MTARSATPEPPERAVAVRPNVSLALLSVAHAINHAQVALMPLVFIAIIPEFGIGVADVALLVTVGNILSGSMQLSFGALTRIAPRRVILGIGNLVFGGAMAAIAATSSFLPFAATSIVSRVGGAPQHPVGNGLLAEQFPPRRLAFAISAHIAGGNLGSVAIPLLGGAVIAAAGWQTAVVVFGLPAIVVGVLMLALIRETGSDRAEARARGSARSLYLSLRHERDLLWLYLSAAIAGGGRGLGVISTFVPLYLARGLGYDTATVAAMYTLLLAGSVPAPLVAGWLADRLGHKAMLVATYVGGAGALAFFALAGSSPPLLWAAIVLLSLFNFAESPQLQALLADVTPGAIRDVAYAVYFTVAFAIGSTWVLLYGGVINALGEAAGFPVVFALMAAAFLAAALAVLPVRAGRRARVPATHRAARPP